MRTLPAIPPPTPVGVTGPGRRYPAPPLGLSSRAAEVLADLRAADAPLAPTAIRDMHDRGTWLPVSIGLASVPLTVPEPLPTRDLTERCAAVSTAMHADYERHLDTLHVLGEISAALAEHPEALAPPSHPGIRLGLRRAHAELLAALAPVEATLKGSVA